MKKLSLLLLLSLFSVVSLTGCDETTEENATQETQVVEPSGQQQTQTQTSNKFNYKNNKHSYEFDVTATKEEIKAEILKNIVTNGTVTFEDFRVTNYLSEINLVATYNGKTITDKVQITIRDLSYDKLYLNRKVYKLDVYDYMSESEIIEEVKKYVETNGNLSIDLRLPILLPGSGTAYITSTLGSESMTGNITLNVKTTEYGQFAFNISRTSFSFEAGVTEAEIKAEIAKYITTNGTVSYSTIDTSVGTHTVEVTSTISNGTAYKSASQYVSISIVSPTDTLTMSVKKTSFEFIYGKTEAEIKAEILKNVESNGQVEVNNISTNVGTSTVTIISKLGTQTKSENVTVTITNDAVLDFSKTSFEFDYGVTVSQIQNAIYNNLLTNGDITYSNISTNVGTQTVRVTATKGSCIITKEVTVTIKEVQAETLYLNLSKEEFTFNYGVTEDQIKEEIAKYVETNGTNIDIENVSTSVGESTVTVVAIKGNETKTLTAKVTITEKVSNDLTLEISNTNFEFVFEATEAEIKAEIAKYVTSNGTVTIGNILTGEAGTQTVVVSSVLDNKSAYKTVSVTIKPEVILNLDISKTSFEFVYGTTLNEQINVIKKFVVTEGGLSFANLSTAAGTYQVVVYAIKEHKTIAKNITVTVKNSGDAALDLLADSFEFTYGVTESEMIQEISNYAITNGTLSLGSVPTSCGTHQVNLIATYNGKTSAKEVNITIVPNDKRINLQSFSEYPAKLSVDGSTCGLNITLKNDSGKDIEKFDLNVCIVVNGNLVAFMPFSNLTLPISQKTLNQGETSTFRLGVKYNSQFESISYSEFQSLSGYYSGYDYNTLKTCTSFTVYTTINNVVYK